ncbi:hypothetical protein LCGC14_3128200 [marine sediment metagenome]|uniref:Uncharacterized protein n=1 Tax=marine sediment metagenome TaxID=412755 RepID=A0A0F8YPX1_9ZZZZ
MDKALSSSPNEQMQSGAQEAAITMLDALHKHAAENLAELTTQVSNLSQFIHRAIGESVPNNPPEGDTAQKEPEGILHVINNILTSQQHKLDELRGYIHTIDKIV